MDVTPFPIDIDCISVVISDTEARDLCSGPTIVLREVRLPISDA